MQPSVRLLRRPDDRFAPVLPLRQGYGAPDLAAGAVNAEASVEGGEVGSRRGGVQGGVVRSAGVQQAALGDQAGGESLRRRIVHRNGMDGGGPAQQGHGDVRRRAEIGDGDGGLRFPLGGADEAVCGGAQSGGEVGDGRGDYRRQPDGRAGTRRRQGSRQGNIVADAAHGDQHIGRGGGDLRGDAGEIGGIRRVGQMQDGAKAQRTGGRFGAVADLAGESAGVNAGYGQGAGVRVGGARQGGQSGQVAVGRREDADDTAGAQVIDGIAGAAVVPQQPGAGGGDFSGGRGQAGGVGAKEEVNGIVVQQPFRVAAGGGGAAAVVVMPQRGRAAAAVQQYAAAARPVDILDPSGEAGQRLPALGGELAGQRCGNAGGDGRRAEQSRAGGGWHIRSVSVLPPGHWAIGLPGHCAFGQLGRAVTGGGERCRSCWCSRAGRWFR